MIPQPISDTVVPMVLTTEISSAHNNDQVTDTDHQTSRWHHGDNGHQYLPQFLQEVKINRKLLLFSFIGSLFCFFCNFFIFFYGFLFLFVSRLSSP